MRLVVDASVALKWVLGGVQPEPDLHQAIALLRAIGDNSCQVRQPVHWMAEVLAVVARKSSAHCDAVQVFFDKLALSTVESVGIYRLAARLSVQLNHHLFDTLYHAVALEDGATLVTADQTYFTKANALGSILLLKSYVAPPAP